MNVKRNLTDKFVCALRAAPPGQRVHHWDSKVPNFGVRVTDKGSKSYVVYVRWPGSKVSARRAVGNADKMSLAVARKRAREWLELVELGTDPAEKQRSDEKSKQQREAVELARRQNNFGSVAEAWIASPRIRKLRKAAEMERHVRYEFIRPWGALPITEITRRMIEEVIRKKAEGLSPAPNAKKIGPAPEQARNILASVKMLFDWAVRQEYGIAVSPAEKILGSDLIGDKNQRDRVLTNAELGALWRAADRLEYPYGPMIKMLALTGQRRSEVAASRRSEIDLVEKLWTIPKERMKMKKPHEVPLTDATLNLIEGLPCFNRGDHLFSVSFGDRSVTGFTKAKERIDELMADELGYSPKHWTLHDIRRTMRTGLSPLPIEDHIRELVIAHAPPGMKKIYDHYHYRPEKREALVLWEEKLHKIVG